MGICWWHASVAGMPVWYLQLFLHSHDFLVSSTFCIFPSVLSMVLHLSTLFMYAPRISLYVLGLLMIASCLLLMCVVCPSFWFVVLCFGLRFLSYHRLPSVFMSLVWCSALFSFLDALRWFFCHAAFSLRNYPELHSACHVVMASTLVEDSSVARRFNLNMNLIRKKSTASTSVRIIRWVGFMRLLESRCKAGAQVNFCPIN